MLTGAMLYGSGGFLTHPRQDPGLGSSLRSLTLFKLVSPFICAAQHWIQLLAEP